MQKIMNGEYKSLTSFRFICALVVFLFHCSIHFNWRVGITVLDRFINNSATFMTVFFVLSGYIMAVVYRENNFSDNKNIFLYWIKRFAKIYPAYVVSTIAYFLIFRNYSATQWMLIIANDVFLTQAFIRETFLLGINGGTWSISNEVVFYFLFPFLILIFKKNEKALFVFGGLLVFLMNINIVGVSRLWGIDSVHFYSNPLARSGEFMIGMAFGLNAVPALLKRINPIFIALSIVFLTSLRWSSVQYVYMGLNFILVPAFALLMAQIKDSKNAILNNSLFVYLGKISYSFYLFQFIPMEIAKGFYQKNPDINLHLVMGLTFVLNIGVSMLSFHFLEEPLRKKITLKMTRAI
jgi:peptidoglycan/LPS O-acetylase OafA/YrhL